MYSPRGNMLGEFLTELLNGGGQRRDRGIERACPIAERGCLDDDGEREGRKPPCCGEDGWLWDHRRCAGTPLRVKSEMTEVRALASAGKITVRVVIGVPVGIVASPTATPPMAA